MYPEKVLSGDHVTANCYKLCPFLFASAYMPSVYPCDAPYTHMPPSKVCLKSTATLQYWPTSPLLHLHALTPGALTACSITQPPLRSIACACSRPSPWALEITSPSDECVCNVSQFAHLPGGIPWPVIPLLCPGLLCCYGKNFEAPRAHGDCRNIL